MLGLLVLSITQAIGGDGPGFEASNDVVTTYKENYA